MIHICSRMESLDIFGRHIALINLVCMLFVLDQFLLRRLRRRRTGGNNPRCHGHMLKGVIAFEMLNQRISNESKECICFASLWLEPTEARHGRDGTTHESRITREHEILW